MLERRELDSCRMSDEIQRMLDITACKIVHEMHMRSVLRKKGKYDSPANHVCLDSVANVDCAATWFH